MDLVVDLWFVEKHLSQVQPDLPSVALPRPPMAVVRVSLVIDIRGMTRPVRHV